MGTLFRDRVSTYPNRFKLKKADGTSELVTLERADSPTTIGTPLNADTLNAAFSERAPAGYGLGVTATDAKNATYVANADEATETGWYKIDKDTTNGVGVSAIMRVEAYSPTYITQTAIRASGGYIQQRYCNNGTWDTEWSWVTIPLKIRGYASTDGANEYRTTERWNEKPVYTALVDLGLSSSGGTTVETSIVATTVLRYSGRVDNFAMPSFYGNSLTSDYSLTASVWVNNGKIKTTFKGGLYLYGNNEKYRAYMQFWYTKD